ncbi:MAG: DUF1015 domain-containing protein [Anaerolineales bacterium]
MKTFDTIGVQVPQILLPRPGINLHQWAVVACDQYTSQPEYWQAVQQQVGEAPSTLHITLPEIYLEDPNVPQRIENIQATMQRYLSENLLQSHENFIYVERTVGERTRKGLMVALDLERYDYTKGSTSLIRATEGTIVERLPPRIKIRQGAPLELPHILVLIDDPEGSVIEAIAQHKEKLPLAYDFDLMQDSGHLRGYHVTDEKLETQVIAALEKLAQPQVFAAKYGIPQDSAPLLFAMGDGNHSLATAKAIWEQIKAQVGPNHPARYALVELENVHDTALEFEPIHRVLFGVQRDLLQAAHDFYGEDFSTTPVENLAALTAEVDAQTGAAQKFGIILPNTYLLAEIRNPATNLPVGTLQAFLDHFLKTGGAEKIDYVHGADVTARLGAQPNNAGFYLPAMPKSDLFKTVILDGALPRKTFSMGAAWEKRFYMEARKIA